jgi:hypothetical protein
MLLLEINSGYYAKRRNEKRLGRVSFARPCLRRTLARMLSVPGTQSVPGIANVYAACHDVTDVTDDFGSLYPSPTGCGETAL